MTGTTRGLPTKVLLSTNNLLSRLELSVPYAAGRPVFCSIVSSSKRTRHSGGRRPSDGHRTNSNRTDAVNPLCPFIHLKDSGVFVSDGQHCVPARVRVPRKVVYGCCRRRRRARSIGLNVRDSAEEGTDIQETLETSRTTTVSLVPSTSV